MSSKAETIQDRVRMTAAEKLPILQRSFRKEAILILFCTEKKKCQATMNGVASINEPRRKTNITEK